VVQVKALRKVLTFCVDPSCPFLIAAQKVIQSKTGGV